jgi:hypothetical protein
VRDDVMFLGFLGVSMLFAALRGYGSCEALAFPNAITGRRHRVGCVIYTPINAAETRHRARSARALDAARRQEPDARSATRHEPRALPACVDAALAVEPEHDVRAEAIGVCHEVGELLERKAVRAVGGRAGPKARRERRPHQRPSQ